MSMTDPHDSAHRDPDARTGPIPAGPAAPPPPSIVDQIGGVRGFVYSTIPVLVFVVANALLSLTLTVVVSLAAGLVLTVFRLMSGERLTVAMGSIVGVALASMVLAATGSARDFFAIGIWISFVGFVVFFGSVLLRRPLTGSTWNLAHGNAYDWRSDPPSLRAHDIATLAAAATFLSRFVVQQWLYLADSTTALGVARIAMGTPLSVLSIVAFVWAYRRTSKRLVPTP